MTQQKQFSVTELSALAGISRVSLYRYLKQGKLSFQLDSNGNKFIEASEAFRFMSTLGVTPVTTKPVTELLHETAPEVSKLQLEVTLLRELLQAKDALIEDQSKRLLLLEDLRHMQEIKTVFAPEAKDTVETPQRRRKRGLFERVSSAIGEALKD